MYGEEGTWLADDLRRRNRRVELRTTAEERILIERAVKHLGTDMTTFIVEHACQAARDVLAGRDRFDFDERTLKAWEELNRRPARDLPGVRRLLSRPSPFGE